MRGRDLRTIREQCGTTMGDLADELGWSLPTLSDKERGAIPVSIRDVEIYVAALAELVRRRSVVHVAVLGAASEG